MLDFNIVRDPLTNETYLETAISGKLLLTTPQLNKGTAFSQEERHAFGLLGKLPHCIESLDDQVNRAYLQYKGYTSRLQQHIYLNNLHDKNQILFYKLLSCNLAEMLPIIYTPIVGAAVQSFSREYRQPRGLYISHLDQNNLDEILNNRSNPDIDLIVVTDGEGILGIGDQGIGGMDIPVAKLMVYSLCGGIDPTRTLPIFLDVGTNNTDLLQDPMYLGCRHPRIYTEQYNEFIECFTDAVKRHFPRAFLHWEDLGRDNARRILDTYENELCTFNDDIQGTGAVTLAALLSACNITESSLSDQRIIIYGAGSAGTGIADQLVDGMMRLGLSRDDAYQRFWLFDRQGLLVSDDSSLTLAQQPYARKPSEIQAWMPLKKTYPSLAESIKHIHPTVLIGCSAQPKAFSEEIIVEMASFVDRPIIFPLSNPDEKCEAHPKEILTWSQGKALIATGTEFQPVQYKEHLVNIAQCNNALIFPGIGLGILAVQAKKLTADMLWAAASSLAELSPCIKDSFLPLLPSLSQAQVIAKKIAYSVAKTALDAGLAHQSDIDSLEEHIKALYWEPMYLPYRKPKLGG